jgi:hypothetical protein
VEGAFPKQFETEAEAHQYIKEFPERTRNSNDQGQFNAILEKLHDRPLRYTGQLNEELEPYKQGEDKHLKDALEYEGDTMGHCIGAGGYFDDVMSGDSNIYSLRNKKTGAPHVTVQTIHHPIYTWDDISHVYGKEKAQQLYDSEVNDPDNPENFQNVVNQLPIKKVLAIEQIKGKGNKKPVDRYIPYVQDFVKSGNWDTVGDIQNTGLRLMDGRYTPYSHLVHQMTKAGEDVPKYMTEEEYKAAEKRHYPQAATGGAIIAKAVGGSIDPQKAIRRALMVAREPHMAKGGVPPDDLNDESTRILVPAIGSGGIKGIVVPRHMLEGKVYAGDGPKSGERVAGMNEINAARAAVYGPENRDPLNVGQIRKIHEQTLAEHFSKPIAEQKSIEKAALDKLRKAKHINNDANTLDESEKTDTVKYEPDSYEPWTSKGIAGHALYTSGHGATQVRHVINTCPGQTVGCGGGVDENGIVDTSKGTCFAPNAESQYVNAAVRRACHEQAKFDPAMTKDWIFAHTGSLRSASEKADKKRQKTMFRPNVVDETDTSSRHVLEGLNEQRKAKGLPMIIANSYGKTDELHDPENGYYVTHSNIGPKVKNGASISDNIGRDKQRIRRTITATTASGKDFTNIQGNITPPKNSYMVTDVKRGSDLDKRMQGAITHAKYWSYPRSQQELSPEEISEGAEAHFDGDGNATTVDKSHYGHTTIDGRRYDYQKQHIIHPRLVSVPVTKTNKNTKIKTTEIKKIPTDSRFKDNDFLPSEETRFKTKNGKIAGAILMTTPTESTSNLGHETEFTHHVGDSNVAHALQNNGEYEIDSPMAQEAARGNQYITPKPIEFKKHSKVYAKGGFVDEEENSISLPEQNFHAQAHLGHHSDSENDHKLHHGHRKILSNSQIVDHALRLTAALRKR